jgi:hypothetical protein
MADGDRPGRLRRPVRAGCLRHRHHIRRQETCQDRSPPAGNRRRWQLSFAFRARLNELACDVPGDLKRFRERSLALARNGPSLPAKSNPRWCHEKAVWRPSSAGRSVRGHTLRRLPCARRLKSNDLAATPSALMMTIVSLLSASHEQRQPGEGHRGLLDAPGGAAKPQAGGLVQEPPYQAASWTKPRRVVAKVESHPWGAFPSRGLHRHEPGHG